MRTVAERAQLYLEKLPAAVSGSGGHDATFRAAGCLVHGFALPEEDALMLLRQWNQSHCQPPWRDRELQHKIRSALGKAPEKPRGWLLNGSDVPDGAAAYRRPYQAAEAPSWPEMDRASVERLAAGKPSLEELWNLSPMRPDGMDAEALVDVLFPGTPWICAGSDQRHARTARREGWRGQLGQLQFIVPNPMTGPTGKTQSGRGDSPRCLDNTGPRRFLVIECDFRPEDGFGIPGPDLCAGVLSELARLAPLVLGVHSGGKSLHGWFYCAGQDEERLRRFMRYAVSLGADRATWTRCQFVRMPEGCRDNGRRQRVLFFNPGVITDR